MITVVIPQSDVVELVVDHLTSAGTELSVSKLPRVFCVLLELDSGLSSNKTACVGKRLPPACDCIKLIWELLINLEYSPDYLTDVYTTTIWE